MKKIIVGIVVVVAIIMLGVWIFKSCDSKGNSSEVTEYTITYNLNGGEGVGNQIKVKNYSDYELPEVSKTGYKFYGWYSNAKFSGSPITIIKSGNTSNIELYAKFSKIYNITYIADGGTHLNVTTFTVEDRVVLEPATKNGYVFLGWYDTETRQGNKIEVITQQNDVMVFAKYGLAYSINYDLDGGVNNAENPDEFCAEQRIVLKPATKNGYKFVGWYRNDGSEVTTIPLGTTEEVSVHAAWEIATYNVTWDLAGGWSNATFPTQYTFGEGISEDKFVYPTKENLIFAGWYTDRDGASVNINKVSDSDYGDMTIYAKWMNPEVVNLGTRWTWTGTSSSQFATPANDANALTVTVPEELMNALHAGRLGLEVKGTFYANVRSQGNATGNVTSYMIVDGSEYYVCSASAKGGGYPLVSKYLPQDGPWGCSGDQTKNVRIHLNKGEIKIGYRYTMTSDITNANNVKASMEYGCIQLVCRFYII